MVKGQDLIGDEFYKLWSVYNNLTLFLNSNNDKIENRFFKFIKEKFGFKSSNLKKKYKNENIRIKLTFKISIEINNSSELFHFLTKTLNLNIKNCKFYDRIYINNIMYSVNNKPTRFSNDLIFHNNKLGLVSFIVHDENNNIHIICKELLYMLNPFYLTDVNNLKSNFMFYSKSRSYFSISHSNLLNTVKLFYYEYSDSLFLISKFTSNHIYC